MNVRDNEERTACTNKLKTLYLIFCLFREANEAHKYTQWSEQWVTEVTLKQLMCEQVSGPV
jgi:hypothetical protein